MALGLGLRKRREGRLMRFKERTSRARRRAVKMHKERAKTGFEVEFLMVDKEGRISTEADRVLSHIRGNDLRHEAVRECCHSFIEMGVYPRIYVRNVAVKFLEDMEGVLDVAEKYGIGFFPMAMYPYRYEPKMRAGGWYGIKERIFGERWQYAGRCAGFHFHYSLPKGIFRYGDRQLEESPFESEKANTVHSYNFATAIDPVLTAFTQSSPLFQGRFLGKDSRALLYRGGKELGYGGMYSDYSLFGGLLPYIGGYERLAELAEERYSEWRRIVAEAGADPGGMEGKNRLDFAWNPVKINKVGSIELRNMDMNMPSTLMAVSVLTKYALRDIQREGLKVVTDPLAKGEPFKLEDGRIFVPPFEHVSEELQRAEAWEGLENDALYTYCKKFFSLAAGFVNKKYYPILKPVKDMLKKRKTRSDEMLSLLEKRGHSPREEEVSEDALRELVLRYSGRLRKDISETRELMESLTEGDRVWL